MKRLTERNTSIKNQGIIISFFCYIIFSFFSDKASSGIRNGIEICLTVLIPSLFLMIWASSFFISCGFPPTFRKRINKFFSFSFGISGNSAEAVFSGLTGGYNIASKWAVKLMNRGIISREEAKRTAVYFTSPGISFCINVAGSSIYGCRNTGIRFLISSVLSSFICAFVSRRIKKQTVSFVPYSNSICLSQAMTDSVEAASGIIFNICSWVILYYGISPILGAVIKNRYFTEFVRLFGEVTSGISHSSSLYSQELSAFIVSFGGICILLQQLPDIIKLGINPFVFLLQRITISLISSGIFSLSLKIFPVSKAVYLHSEIIRPYSHSPFGAVCLMLLCSVFLLSIKNTHSNAIKLRKRP